MGDGGLLPEGGLPAVTRRVAGQPGQSIYGMVRFIKPSKRGTVKAVSPWEGL
jgi:hypothetical protein